MSVWLSATTLAVLAASTQGPLLRQADLPDSGARSVESSTATTVHFANQTEGELSLYWVNFRGVRELYGKILPHTSRSVRTYLTHPWIAVDAEGRMVGTFLPQREEATALIQPRLVAQAPSAETRLHSQESKEPGTIRFVNRTGGLIHLYWLDYKGERALRARVPAGGEYVVETFASHPWVAVDEKGATLGVYEAQRGDFMALISTSGVAP